MSTRDIIVIGSSAGGIEALRQVCAGLPADLPASVFITQHIPATARSVLPQLLQRASPLPVISPVEGQEIELGRIYVAAPDLHMLLRPGKLLMRRGPYENRTRPAINPLFRSAAVHYGARVIGVVLSGLLDDGTEGLITIKAAGGVSVIQDPADAEWPSMPRNALERDHVDHVAPVASLAGLLAELARQECGPTQAVPRDYIVEDRIAAQEFAVMDPAIETPGEPSHISCPDCGGVLNQLDADAEVRFRCQVGHAFSALGLAAAQNDQLERALAIAVRTHRDRIRLFDQMSSQAESKGLSYAESRWQAAAEDSQQMIEVLEEAMASLRKVAEDGSLP